MPNVSFVLKKKNCNCYVNTVMCLYRDVNNNDLVMGLPTINSIQIREVRQTIVMTSQLVKAKNVSVWWATKYTSCQLLFVCVCVCEFSCYSVGVMCLTGICWHSSTVVTPAITAVQLSLSHTHSTSAS